MTETAPAVRHTIGKGIPKRDAKLKACGAARYAGDMRPSKQPLLCGKILRSPHAHAAIVSIDTSKAVALKGVYAVVVGEDATSARIGRFLRDRTVLARDKVRHIGEPVAAVAAIDEATALEALSLIHVEYQPLPVVLTPEESLAADAPTVHEDLAHYEDVAPTQRCGNQRHLMTIERGDVEAAFAGADIVVEGHFTTQPVHAGFIEPKACVADVDKHGKLTIWSSNKAPFLNRTMTSRGLGVPLSTVRVISPTIGGDFGGKGAPTIEPIAGLLALKAGRAVKLALDAQEELATSFVRHYGGIRLRIAADRTGKLLGVEGELVYNCGAYCDGILGSAQSCGTLSGPYNVPAIRVRGQSVFTNSIPAGHVRAPSAPQPLFAIETLMDELARRLAMDPFALRRLNALKEGDPAPGGRGVMGHAGMSETIDKAAACAGEHMVERKANRGIGVACGGWDMSPARDQPSKSIVKLNEDGSATLLTGLPDNGAGQHGVLAQVVGEILGLGPTEVAVVGGDTELAPFDSGPGGSQGTVRVGRTSKFAAEDVRRQLFAIAASKLEANPEDLAIADRRVYVKGTPERGIGLAQLAGMALASPRGGLVGTGASEREQWVAEESQRPPLLIDAASFCAHVAEVEVDPETGKITVLKYVAAQDVGYALNPVHATGQIHGAVVAGLGYALSEELIVKEGRVTNPTYADYRMPAADMTPAVEAILVEVPSHEGPFGARGVGETSIGPVAAAIGNAVYDAVGVRVWDLPMTPERVLLALKAKRSS